MSTKDVGDKLTKDEDDDDQTDSWLEDVLVMAGATTIEKDCVQSATSNSTDQNNNCNATDERPCESGGISGQDNKCESSPSPSSSLLEDLLVSAHEIKESKTPSRPLAVPEQPKGTAATADEYMCFEEEQETQAEEEEEDEEHPTETIGITILRRHDGAPITSIRNSTPGAFSTSRTGSVQTSPLPSSSLLSGALAQTVVSTTNHRLTTCSTLPPQEPPSRRQTNVQLVVANPVTDMDPTNLPVAEELHVGQNNLHPQRQQQQKKHDKLGQAVILTLVLVAGVTILLVALLLLTTNDNDHSGSNSDADSNEQIMMTQPTPTLTPQSSLTPEDYLRSLLPDYTLAALNNPGSPQYKAFHWFLNDPAFQTTTTTTVNTTTTTIYPPWRIRQRMALAIYYYSTIGSEWARNTHWLSYSHHECDWYTADTVPFELARRDLNGTEWFVYFTAPACAANNDHHTYQHFRLFSNNLHGSLPNEIGWLTSLRSMMLISNSIGGTIPSTIGLLTKMETMNWIANQVTGPLPTELGRLTNLIGFGSYVNQMTGTLPSEVALLTKLKEFRVGENQYTGTVPTEYGGMTSMVSLVLNENRLHGSIPSQLQSMTALVQVLLSGNQFTGTVPTFWQQMTDIEMLQLDHNKFHGTIPVELGHLKNVKQLGISNNNLIGPLPSELGLLTAMEALLASSASLSGTVPPALGNLSGLRVLDLTKNPLLSGTIPAELCGMQALLFNCTEVLCGCNCSCTR